MDKAASAFVRCYNAPTFASISMVSSRGCCTLCWEFQCWGRRPRFWSSLAWQNCGCSSPGFSNCRCYCRCGRYLDHGVFVRSVFVRRTCIRIRIASSFYVDVLLYLCQRHNKNFHVKRLLPLGKKKFNDGG